MVLYDLIVVEADRLILKMLVAYMRNDLLACVEARATFLALLSGCGWSEKDFDAETLKRVDANWSYIAGSKSINVSIPYPQTSVCEVPIFS